MNNVDPNIMAAIQATIEQSRPQMRDVARQAAREVMVEHQQHLDGFKAGHKGKTKIGRCNIQNPG